MCHKKQDQGMNFLFRALYNPNSFKIHCNYFDEEKKINNLNLSSVAI